MLTRSKAEQRKRSVLPPRSLGGGWPQGSTARAGGGPFDLPVLSSAEALGWDRDDGSDRGFPAPADFASAPALPMAAGGSSLLPLDEAGFHLDTAGRLDYATPGAASGRRPPFEFLPIHLDPDLADPTAAGGPPPAPPSSRAWQIPNYGGGGSSIAPAPPLQLAGGGWRASFDPVPLRTPAAAAAAAAEEDKRRRNTVASARFRVKKKAREQALETREKDLSVRVGQLRKRIADLEVENRWLRELLLAKKDVGGAAADAQGRVLAQLEAALQELRETVSDEDVDGDAPDGGGGGQQSGSGDARPGTSA